MRNDFVKQTILEMERDLNIVFITGDLGFNALEPIRDHFPKRFINAGIAEQNMMGVAAGLALTGRKVIAYSIASFLTMRPYEQIRSDICYDNLDVKLFGPGGGFNYPTHGHTHHTIEDIAIMNVLPNMKIVLPSYAWEAREATRALIRHDGPTYMRLSKSPGQNYENKKWKFELGKGYEIKSGRDAVIISTGNVLDVAISTAELIAKMTKNKVQVGVVSMPSLKPIDDKLIKQLAHKVPLICTIEEHSIIGGLGSIVANILVQLPTKSKLQTFGIPDRFIKDVGSRNYLLDKIGLEPKALSAQIIKLLKHQK